MDAGEKLVHAHPIERNRRAGIVRIRRLGLGPQDRRKRHRIHESGQPVRIDLGNVFFELDHRAGRVRIQSGAIERAALIGVAAAPRDRAVIGSTANPSRREPRTDQSGRAEKSAPRQRFTSKRHNLVRRIATDQKGA